MSQEKNHKTMTEFVSKINEATIFKLMNTITIAVASVFLIKNLLGSAISGMLAIGICLLVYVSLLAIIKKKYANRN